VTPVTAFLGRAWAWLGPDLYRLRMTEPAMLAARYGQLLSVLAAAGLTIPHVIDYRIGIALAAWGIAAPWVQGKRTRADVFSPQTAADLADLARLFPGLAGEAEKLLRAGWPKWETYLQLDKLARDGTPTAAQTADAEHSPSMAV
jgi:hypothetical protein